MSAKNSTRQTLIVALLLCLVCSIVVSAAAVLLKPRQVANKLLDRNKNILSTVGLYHQDTKDEQVSDLFKKFEPRFLDIRSGELLEPDQAQQLGLDISTYNQSVAAKTPELSYSLSAEQDIASIGGSQAKYVLIYLLKEQGITQRVVLPIHGYGLWGTLYGFMAIENDANTIAGLSFYSHKETPGLGAKVDLPSWKALWPGKKIYEQQQVKIHLTKAKADPNDPYAIDGLSGATLTTRGVDNTLRFWMGDLGYKPFLDRLRAQHLNGSALDQHSVRPSALQQESRS